MKEMSVPPSRSQNRLLSLLGARTLNTTSDVAHNVGASLTISAPAL